MTYTIDDIKRLVPEATEVEAFKDGSFSIEIHGLYLNTDEEWTKLFLTARAEVGRLQSRVETLEEFAESVIEWSESYPEDIFTAPTVEQIDNVCKGLGFRIDRIAAMVLREFTGSWGKRARHALEKGE